MTSPRAIGLAVLLTLAVGVQRASAQCLPIQQFSNSNTTDSIGFIMGNSWGSAPYQQPSISQAVSMWSTACSGMTTDYPTLRVGSYGTITITIEYQTGRAPANSENPQACANFAAITDNLNHVTGGTIQFWQENSQGGACAGGVVALNINEALAHEMGHVLGLGNTSCSGQIMGPNWPSLYGPSQAECAKIDSIHETAAEYDAQVNACNQSCPNHSCSGTPPQCQSPPEAGWQQWCNNLSQCADPLVLDLNGDGIHTTSVDQPVAFDLDADGVKELMSWTNPDTDEGFLYLDLDNKGRVSDGRELFGVGTVMPDGSRGANGFAALAVYDMEAHDGNNDRMISSDDAVWNRLRIWVDRNHNGVCEPSETGPIHRYGIRSIDLAARRTTAVDGAGNIHELESVYRRADRGVEPPLTYLSIHAIGFKRAR